MAFIGGTSEKFVKVFSAKNCIFHLLPRKFSAIRGIRWNPSIADIINWTNNLVPYSKVDHCYLGSKPYLPLANYALQKIRCSLTVYRAYTDTKSCYCELIRDPGDRIM